MKTVITALNSKYIHASLAPWYLKASAGNDCGEIKVLEFTINDDVDRILASIYKEKADNAAFSCYIWNITIILRLVENLKKVSPNIKLILGGPEVTFDAYELMLSNTQIDYTILGEGERTFKLLLKKLYDGNKDYKDVLGIVFREEGKVIENRQAPLIEVLDVIPSPYSEEMLISIKDRIIYFEASRGCPFSCSYCISSTFHGVRNFGLHRVKNDLIKLMNSGIRQIKFVDRTFNCNKARAKEIFKFLINYHKEFLPGRDINFHFEAAADLFDDEIIDILAEAPNGLIQFEVGVQTTNLEVLELINRKTSLDEVFHYVKRIKKLNNINLHLDLIAGLPGEDLNSFKKSFDDVFNLKSNQLQLGFLKLLKGSKIRAEAIEHRYFYKSYPTYEILYNKYISFDEILELKGIEELLDRYYNSGRFVNSLEYIISKFFGSPYNFFKGLLLFHREEIPMGSSISMRHAYDIIFKFTKTIASIEQLKIINELLKLDYLSCDNSNNLPESLTRNFEKDFSDCCFEFLRDANNIRTFLPDFINIPSKQIYKRVHFEIFSLDVTDVSSTLTNQEARTVILFNYDRRSRVTGLYEYQKVPLSNLKSKKS